MEQINIRKFKRMVGYINRRLETHRYFRTSEIAKFLDLSSQTIERRYIPVSRFLFKLIRPSGTDVYVIVGLRDSYDLDSVVNWIQNNQNKLQNDR